MFALLALATTVLAIRTPQAVIIGVDSRVVSVGSSATTAAAEPKLHESCGVIFAHAGLFRDDANTFNVRRSAETAISSGGRLRAIADAFAESLQAPLLRVVEELRAQNLSYYNSKVRGKIVLEVVFATFEDGQAVEEVVGFKALENVGGVGVGVARQRCPGDCSEGVTIVALGRHDAVDAFLDREPTTLRERGAQATILRAIAEQAVATPEEVSLPVFVASVDDSGVKWVTPPD